jgi:hypothetical protein
MDDSILAGMGLGKSLEEYAAQYGEENAAYLAEILGDGLQNYSRYLFIRMGMGPEDEAEAETRRAAKARGWEFASLDGDLRLLRMLCNGDWPEEEFLVAAPGEVVRADYGGSIICACGRAGRPGRRS